MEQFVRPINIPSPISGQPVVPRIIERDYGDKVVVEAHWVDPSSGAFIRKGIVEIREKKRINENFPDPSEMTPKVLRGIRRGEREAYKGAGYRPGERNLAGKGTADPEQNYKIPSREEASQLYRDLDDALERRVYPSEVQDYFAFADGDEGNIKSLYDYEYSDRGERQAILDPIAR